jgi:hypothetical protein
VQPAGSTPTDHRCLMRWRGALCTTGRQTLTTLIRTVRHQATGPVASAPWVCSPRHGSAWAWARRWLPVRLTSGRSTGPVWLAGDDTVAERPASPSAARPGIARACARPTALPRLAGGLPGASCRCWSSGRARSDPGPSRCGWPGRGAPPGRGRRRHAIPPRRSCPGGCERASCAGGPRASAAWWGRPGTARARPPGVVAHPAATAQGSARGLGMPPCPRLLPRARLARGDARAGPATHGRRPQRWSHQRPSAGASR